MKPSGIGLSIKIDIQWNLDLRNTHYTKKSEYKMGFEEISVQYNEKNI